MYSDDSGSILGFLHRLDHSCSRWVSSSWACKGYNSQMKVRYNGYSRSEGWTTPVHKRSISNAPGPVILNKRSWSSLEKCFQLFV